MRAAASIRAVSLVVLTCIAGCASPSAESRPASRPDGPDVPVAVVGNAAVPTEEILAAAKRELEAFQAEGRHETDLDDAAFAMAQSLKERGLAHATATFEFDPAAAPPQVVFRVTEGPLATFDGVAFEGNASYPAERLAKFFDFRAKGQSPDEPVPFLRRAIDGAVSDVESFYRTEGFHRVQVGPLRVAWNDAETSARVVLPVDEGPVYVVRRVVLEIDGADVPRADLARRAKAFEGRPFSSRVPAEAVAAIRAALSDEGRLFMTAAADAKVDDAKAEAEITLRVRPGPEARIGEIVVKGEDRTDVDFIIEESLLRSHDVLAQRRFDEAVDRLYGTGLFRTVTIEKKPEPTEGDVAVTDLEIEVAEVMARTIDFEAGFGSYELLRGDVRYRDRNLFGRGRVLEVTPSASLKGYGAEMKLFDNYVFGRENTLEFTTHYTRRREPTFDATAFQVETAVRHRFDRRLSARAGYRLRLSDATDVFVDVPADQVDTAGFSSGPFLEAEYDGRDDVFNPHRGWLVSGGVAWSTPQLGADFDYLETKLACSTYVSLGEDTVLAFGVSGSDREILNDAANLPIQERFFLGGDNSVRSFNESELGPVDGGGRPVGGRFSLEGSVELRQRLTGDLYGAVFYDLGTIGREGFDLRGPYGHAIGAGLRYLFPFGPVRLDFGYNPGRRFAADQNWAVHLSFGFSF